MGTGGNPRLPDTVCISAHPDVEGSVGTKPLDGKSRFKGCLSYSSNSPQPHGLPEIFSIRTSISSQNIHKDPKASSQFPEESQCEDVSIHRRHSSDSRHKSLRQQLHLVSSTLTALGFALNKKKCILEPTQQIEFWV